MRASSSRRYLSVWLRRLATDRIVRRLPTLADTPLVLVGPVKSALRIAALNDEAARLKLRAGMALADARAMYPSLAVMDADPAADKNLLEAVADWCDRYTPLVGLDPPDGLVFDITGCVHLFGGEAPLCSDIIARLAAQGFAARVAIADTVGCAWAAARYGEFSSPSEKLFSPSPLQGEVESCIVPKLATRAALAPLPVAALRLAAEIVDALAQVGLKQIADVLDKPRAPLAARFGIDFVRRLDQALGLEDEPITPRLPVPSYVAEQRFADPIALERDVLATIEHLADELARMLERRGDGARQLQAALFRTDGKVARIAIGTSAPLRDPARIRRLFTDRLAALGDECDPGFGFDVVRLSALIAERLDPAQTGLTSADAPDLAHLVDRLGARFGLRRVSRLVPQDTHIPEFAVAAVPAASFSGRNGARCSPLTLPTTRYARGGRGVREALALDEQNEKAQDTLAPARPLRLFARPEPVEAVAEVPDGPPVRFRWRRILHEVAHVEGPERIAMEWWRDDAGARLTRDYFRVESRDGMRAWLYREGLYGRAAERPRWFLHGLFA